MRARLAPLLLAGLGALAAPVLADGQLEDPRIAERAGPPPAKPFGLSEARRAESKAAFLSIGPRASEGALAGKTVYVSAGHGWVWDANLGRWRTQRGNTHDLVEDFISTETISQHLIPLLHDMGAYVVPVREADLSTEMLLVDDADAEVNAATGAAEGFATPAGPLTGAANPFAGGGSQLATATATEERAARWVLDSVGDVEAFVYLSWVQAADRAPDAHYVIHHAGGDSHVRVDQRRHGSTWVLVGHFRFSPADPPERRSIELLTDSTVPGATLSIDAVRVGGGMSHVDRGMGTSGRPAFEDGARYAAQWNGAPSTVWDYTAEDGNDDVGTRSRFAAWDHEAGEDAVYVAWHTNAPSPARGTSSFAYGPSAYGPLSEFSGVPGSLQLMDAIHKELIADLRASWEPTWQDRQQHTAYFGEVNPSHNPEMPATLIEVAFHDTLADANALREPAFRHVASRAIAQGIAKYFATRDGLPLTLPPGQPTAPHARWQGSDLVIAWSPPAPDPAGGDAPTGYRVHLSPDGRAFDDGRDVDGTSTTIPAAALGNARFARIVAHNAGGRSRPSSVVGAGGLTPPVTGAVLVVTGFTRLDGTMLFREDLSSRSLATIDRAFEARINDGSHGARVALALARANYGSAIASIDAVRAGAVPLADYRAVVWLTGEEIAPLTAEDRAMLAAYLDEGGALVLSGAEAAAGLAAEDAAFLASLGAGFAADDAGTYLVIGARAIAGYYFMFDISGPGSYDADAPDVLTASGDAVTLLTYEDGSSIAALVQTSGRRAAVLGFPIDVVRSDVERSMILAAALAELGVEPEELPCACLGGCCDASDADPRGTFALVLVVTALLLTRTRRLTTIRPHGFRRRCSR